MKDSSRHSSTVPLPQKESRVKSGSQTISVFRAAAKAKTSNRVSSDTLHTNQDARLTVIDCH
jgi:hypothetical protein